MIADLVCQVNFLKTSEINKFTLIFIEINFYTWPRKYACSCFCPAAVVLAFDRLYKQLPVLTVKNLRGRMVRGDGEFDSPPCGFSKNICSRERMKPWFFVTFNISISHIFPKNFIQIPQVVQKIWRFSPSI